MVFKSINGLVESQDFADFWRWHSQNSNKLKCPVCDKKCFKEQHFTGFDMNKVGHISFKCKDPLCEFNKTEFTIQAIPRSEQKH